MRRRSGLLRGGRGAAGSSADGTALGTLAAALLAPRPLRPPPARHPPCRCRRRRPAAPPLPFAPALQSILEQEAKHAGFRSEVLKSQELQVGGRGGGVSASSVCCRAFRYGAAGASG